MKEINLTEFVKEHTQQGAAEIMGITQGAVWQALKANRDIRVVVDAQGGFFEGL